MGGFLEGLRAWDKPCEPVGLVRAQAWPGGPVSAETLLWFKEIVEEQISRARPLDGVLCALHGAMVGEGEPDVDGCLLEEVLVAAGPDAPIVATVDLHAHGTARMLNAADAIVAYHTSPHLDRRQTGVRAAGVLERLLGAATPTAAHVRLPMITSAELHLSSGPVLGPVFERLHAMEQQPDVLSAALLMTQPWLDVPRLGWSVVVTTDGRPGLARHLADELAPICWDRRAELSPTLHSASACIERALQCPGQPVVVANGADATNCGAGGDGMHLLGEMIGTAIPGGALAIMVDPEAVAHARAVGPGGPFRFAVGGKRDHVFSRPLDITGEVLSVDRAHYVLTGNAAVNLPIDMGLSAVVKTRDVTLVLVERPGPGSTPMMYRCVGLEPTDFKIVEAKSPCGFRAEFEPFAAEILLADCPGCASPHLADMPFTHVDRPLWPLDEIADWRSVDWLGSDEGSP